MTDRIRLLHGDGGKHMNQMIQDIFYNAFDTPIDKQGTDGATLTLPQHNIVFTTDSFVIKPIFFSGGDIGKLAVCGTLNDLAVSGAKPLYLSLGMIIEEGFSMNHLIDIVQSIKKMCNQHGVQIVTGDTKVVDKGYADQIFINTSGIGIIINDYHEKELQSGDEIIITGSIGEHGATIASERYDIGVFGDIKSDCSSIFPIIMNIKDCFNDVKLMKDPTRGGIASILNEITNRNKIGIELIEDQIPISTQVQAVSNLLGFDPLYLACEGRALIIVEKGKGDRIAKRIQQVEIGKKARVIGKITNTDEGFVIMHTKIGGRRLIRMLESPMLPRIC